jgi:hypothetical protein
MTGHFAAQGQYKYRFPMLIDIPLDDTLDRANLGRLLASVESPRNCVCPRGELRHRSVPPRMPGGTSPVPPFSTEVTPAAPEAGVPVHSGIRP